MPEQWQSISRRKLEHQASCIPQEWLLPARFTSAAGAVNNVVNVPRECGLLTDVDLEITEARDATALVEKLAKGELKSADVVRAFCKVGSLPLNLLLDVEELRDA
jgi:amidase